MKQSADLRTQAQQDRIENGPCCWFIGAPQDVSDDYQFILWNRKIFVDITAFDVETNTATITGNPIHCAAAIRVLKNLGVKVKLPV